MSIPDNVADLWAQSSHLGWSAFAVMAPAALFPRFIGAPIIGFCAIIAFAAAKEFWWDLRNETPDESGGIGGGWEDFSHYLCGAVAAILLLAIDMKFGGNLLCSI